MKTIVLNEMDPIYEAVSLLELIAEDISYNEYKEELLTKYRIEEDTIKDRVSKVDKIYQFIKSQLDSDKERILFYFKAIGEKTDNLASFVLLYNNYLVYDSLEELRNNVITISEEERLKEFASRLDGLQKLGITEDYYEEINLLELIRKINNVEIDSDSKLIIQQIYLNRELYLDELLKIVNKTVELFDKCKEDIKILTNQFYIYWEQFIQNQDIHEYLKKEINISYDKSEKGTTIAPSIFYCSRCSLSSGPNEENEVDSSPDLFPDLFRIGILHDDKFKISTHFRDTTTLNQALKLLSDKSKFEILMLIKDKSAYGSELAKSLELSTATISYHMTSLIQLGLVKVEKSNNRVYYSSNKTKIEECLQEAKRLLLE